MTSSPPTSPSGARPVRPAAEVWSIAWPTVLTMTSYTVMQFVDKLMVGQVGPLEVAAQGNGGIWAFMPIAIALGFLTVVNTFVSQNLGAGHPENGPKYAWAGIWISILVWIVVLLPLGFLLPLAFSAVHDNVELIALETKYGRILLAGGVLTLLGRAMHHYFFGLHRPKIITVSAITGNLVNGFLNYALIFGAAGIPHLDLPGLPAMTLPGVPGAPQLGLAGAAVATVVGTAVELVIPFAVFLGPKMNRELATRRAWRPALQPVRDLGRIGWPGAIQFGNEMVCWALFMTVLVGVFGEDHMAAGWIALGYMHLSFMPAVGFSVAATSLVGKYIGAGQPDVAVARARLCVGIAVAYMTVCGLLFLVFRRPMTDAFIAGNAPPEEAARILSIGARLLVIAAVFQTIDACGIVYTGALRGAGDTVWPGVVTVLYSWTLIIGGGWAAIVWLPGLESIGPWVAASAYIILYGVTMAIRFESGRWRSIKLLGSTAEDAAIVAPIGPGPPATDPEASGRDRAEGLPTGSVGGPGIE